MADIELVIKIPEEDYDYLYVRKEVEGKEISYYNELILNGTPLPKGHGKIVDIGKIDKDRTERDNPVIYLTVNGECIEAVSLDYLNGLSAIIEADEED